jgi:hypothetical protein
MAYPNDEWQRKGATLSDKTARQEFGLTQDEISRRIRRSATYAPIWNPTRHQLAASVRDGVSHGRQAWRA